MPAQSQQQQKLFGFALSVKRGETPRSEASEDVLGIVDSMTEKEIEDFASTTHKGLPKKVDEFIREEVRKHINENIPRMYKVYLGVQNKLRKLEDEQKKMLGQFKDEKDPKKKRNILDKMKEGTVRLKKVRANLADIEREYINKAAYDTSYSENIKISKDDMDKLHSDGEVEVDGEKVTYEEGIEPQIKKIAYFTGTRPEAVEDFVSKHALNFTKLLKYVQKGGLPQRIEFVSALAGRPNNPKQKKIIKQFQESVNEEFKSKDSTFEKVYGIFDKRDYFNAKGLAKVQIGNFERALQKKDKGAQQILDKFKGDVDKAKDYIIQVITDRKKEDAFNQYKAFKAAVDSIQKGKPIYGAVDLVKSRIHNNSQKYTIALYSALRNQKFTKWKDIHDDVDSLIGESVNEARFDRNKLMRIMKKYDDAMIYTADGNEFLIYSPYSNNKDNADMWHKNSVFALDKDATEHEIDYKDIVKIKG